MILDIDPSNYEAPKAALWDGRPITPNLGTQYWYQAIELVDILEREVTSNLPQVGLVGYAIDEGVRRNRGRIGAAEGPNQLRERLAKLSYHFEDSIIGDYGNIICPEQKLEASQQALSSLVSALIISKVFPIVLGGGHDVAYGHFKGLKQQVQKKIGIINFDAHFDLRPLEKEANSGTPFLQILTEFPDSAYFALGIQGASNSKELFEIAKSKGVQYLEWEDCTLSNINKVFSQLEDFAASCDYLYLSIDLDGFSSAYAPGVSAPSPLGLTPIFVLKVIAFLFQTQKVIACDIAEMNPKYDRDQSTANLGARLVNGIISYFQKYNA